MADINIAPINPAHGSPLDPGLAPFEDATPSPMPTDSELGAIQHALESAPGSLFRRGPMRADMVPTKRADDGELSDAPSHGIVGLMGEL